MFDPAPADSAAAPRLVTASVAAWEPGRPYDLITCFHGLHYVGDKLALLTRTAGWLAPGGLMTADLDLASIRLPGGLPATARRRIHLQRPPPPDDPHRPGRRHAPYAYLGADDHAGPGYTGQPCVDSHYTETR